MGGTAEVQLFYLASEQELLDRLPQGDSALEQKALEKFLADEGLDDRRPDTVKNINKFITKKEFRF
ncbi:MAG: hypothetical protein EA357_00495 [Micavibrio sp.]|nr:MAG: hypothetical protein EA357_00495 [Micavibrio sp.]